MEYVVYCIETLNNGHKYYGRSQEFEKRKRSHMNMLRSYSHHSALLQENFANFGEANLMFTILHVFDSIEEAQQKEAELIGLGEYNVSNSSVGGGDNFTRNQRKEEIREMRRKQMSGKGNNQYGKPKSSIMINAVKKANSKRIKVDDVFYDSIKEFGDKTGVKSTTVCNRLKSPNFENYQYA